MEKQTEVSSNLRWSTEGNTKEPAKYLLFLNYLKMGCCSWGRESSVEDWPAHAGSRGCGENCWAALSLSLGDSYPHSPFYSSGACTQSGSGIRSCPQCSHRPADSLRCWCCTRWCLGSKTLSCHSRLSLTRLTVSLHQGRSRRGVMWLKLTKGTCWLPSERALGTSWPPPHSVDFLAGTSPGWSQVPFLTKQLPQRAHWERVTLYSQGPTQPQHRPLS